MLMGWFGVLNASPAAGPEGYRRALLSLRQQLLAMRFTGLRLGPPKPKLHRNFKVAALQLELGPFTQGAESCWKSLHSKFPFRALLLGGVQGTYTRQALVRKLPACRVTQRQADLRK